MAAWAPVFATLESLWPDGGAALSPASLESCSADGLCAAGAEDCKAMRSQSFLIHFGLSLAAALLCPLGEPSDGLRGLLRVVMGVPGHRELGTLIIYLPTVSKPPHGGHAKGR